MPLIAWGGLLLDELSGERHDIVLFLPVNVGIAVDEQLANLASYVTVFLEYTAMGKKELRLCCPGRYIVEAPFFVSPIYAPLIPHVWLFHANLYYRTEHAEEYLLANDVLLSEVPRKGEFYLYVLESDSTALKMTLSIESKYLRIDFIKNEMIKTSFKFIPQFML